MWNLYTPLKRYCGCVATAAGQVMAYFQWPRGTVTPGKVYAKATGVEGIGGWHVEYGYQATAEQAEAGEYTPWEVPFGGEYDDAFWMDVASGNASAMSRLVRDIGVASYMSYGSDGSAAYTAIDAVPQPSLTPPSDATIYGSRRRVTIECSVSGAKAAVRLGADGRFEVLVRGANGGREWVAVSAEGVTPSKTATYRVRFTLDCRKCTYAAAICLGGDDVARELVPLVADGGDASFEFPDGQTGLVKDVRYAGDGSVTYLHGDAKGSARIGSGTLLIVK